MAIKKCLACGQSFQPRPQVPLQTYCSAPSCQQHRKQQWHRNKLQTAPDYQENQQRAQQSWIERNPDIGVNTVGFSLEPISLPVDKILPSRRTPTGVTTSRKYLQIRTSIQEIGLIEPLSVGPADAITDQLILLDDHIRLIALQELGYIEVPCLVATDDESYTYNSRIN